MTTNQPYHHLERRSDMNGRICIKGRNLMPWTVVLTMKVNQLTPEEIAADCDIPVEAVHESIRWLDQMEAWCKSAGVQTKV